MHNSLKYFRAGGLTAILGEMETYLTAQNATGKSISVDGDGNDFVGLLGYLPGNASGVKYSILTREVGNNQMGEAELQQNIDKVTNELGDFVCQCIVADGGNLSVAFLIGK